MDEATQVIMTPEQIKELVRESAEEAAKKAFDTMKPVEKPKTKLFANLPDKERDAALMLGYVNAARRKDHAKAQEYFEEMGGIGECRTHTEGSDNYVVPPTYYTNILMKAQEESILFKDCNVIPVSGKSQIQTYLDAGVSTSYVTEGSAVSASTATLNAFSVTNTKIQLAIKFSNEILEDAPMFMSQIKALGYEAYKSELNRILFTRTVGGGYPFDGLLSSALTSSDLTIVTLGGPTVDDTNLTFAKIMDGFGTLNSEDEGDIKFYGSPSVWAKGLSIQGTDGHPILWGVGQGLKSNWLGIDFTKVKEMPSASSINGSSAGFLVLGNLRKTCHVFDRTEVTFKVMTEGTLDSDNLGEKDMTGIVFRKRLGFKVFVPEYNTGEKTGLIVYRVSA